MEDLPERLKEPARHYFNMWPNQQGGAGLSVKEYGKPDQDGKTHVVLYRVESMSVPARGEYFRFRKYEADLDFDLAELIPCSIDGMKLVKKYGFVCTHEHDDDGAWNTTVYSRKV